LRRGLSDLGGTGYQPVPLGNLPSGTSEATLHPAIRAWSIGLPQRSVRLVADRGGQFARATHPKACRGRGFRYKKRRMFKGLFVWFKGWYLGALKSFGYPLIVFLMAVESSVVPVPSELVIPPAAYWANTHQIPLAVWGIVLAGTLGSWLGATAMYWLARAAGRPLFLRYGRYALITPDKIEGAERWAAHYGAMGIFISRLLPVVRHLIGIPAGIVRMNYATFSAFTILGSAIWTAVLCQVGIKMGQDEKLMAGELHRVSLWLGGAMLVLGGLYYFFVHRYMKKKPSGP
jgi:membrane protein DedA with SNARE-associated domain